MTAALPTPTRPLLRFGDIEVDPPVVLAPMAGVTDAVFRRMCRRFGGGLFVSEMLAARTLVEHHPRTLRMAAFGADEPVRSLQLHGYDPAVVSRAVSIAVDELGAEHIDLNLGCPVRKVTRAGGGAAIPERPGLLARLLGAAVSAAGAVPVSMKMRTGLYDARPTFIRAGRIAQDQGIAALALHARSAEQLYAGSARWQAVGELKAAIDSIPVLGNGDVWRAEDALELIRATGCDGVVVGRGCLGRPWLFGQLSDAFARRTPRAEPLLGEVAATAAAHAEDLVDALGERRALRAMRKHAGWYLFAYPIDAGVRDAARRVDTLAALRALLAGLDPTAAPLAGRLVRGPTRGPQTVHLPEGWLDEDRALGSL